MSTHLWKKGHYTHGANWERNIFPTAWRQCSNEFDEKVKRAHMFLEWYSYVLMNLMRKWSVHICFWKSAHMFLEECTHVFWITCTSIVNNVHLYFIWWIIMEFCVYYLYVLGLALIFRGYMYMFLFLVMNFKDQRIYTRNICPIIIFSKISLTKTYMHFQKTCLLKKKYTFFLFPKIKVIKKTLI